MGALVGRERELSVLRGLIDERGAVGSSLLVCGEAGIGKSSLLNAADEIAVERGMRVLKAGGVESEMQLPFAGLHQLLNPVLPAIEHLPEPQRMALEAAFGLAEGPARSPFLTALGALTLLSDNAGGGEGLLILIEDAQWLDRPTADVIAFVARRVASDPIVLLASLRDGYESPLRSSLTELRVERLDQGSAELLVDDAAPGLPSGARTRTLAASVGNPLAIVELSAVFRRRDAASGIRDLVDPDDAPPLTARLEQAFAARVANLPHGTRVLLGVAATDDAGALSEILGATSRLVEAATPTELLGPAIEAGLVSVNAIEISFRHPLVRSAIYQSMPIEQRHAAHRELASVLQGDPDRRAWHLAAAAFGPDEDAVRALEAAAARAEQRGGLAVAITGLSRAARLTADRPKRAELLLRAAELAFELGRPDLVATMLDASDASAMGPLELARRAWIREITDARSIPDDDAVRALVKVAADAGEAGGQDLALRVLGLLANRCWWRDPGPAAQALIVETAIRVAPTADDPRLMVVLAYVAPADFADRVIATVEQATSTRSSDPASAGALGSAATVLSAFDLAIPHLRTLVAALRADGRLGPLPRVLTLYGWCSLLVGDWQFAASALEEAVRLGDETGQPIWSATAKAGELMLEGYRGNQETVRGIGLEAEATLLSVGVSFSLAVLQMSRGLAALTGGRPDEAAEQLGRVFDPADVAFHPAIRGWAIGDLAEAYTGMGRPELVEPFLKELRAPGDFPSTTYSGAVYRYAEALTAPDEERGALLFACLDIDNRWALHRARVQLALGTWLRRHRRSQESRAPLRAARDLFDALGAVPWSDRARGELRAAGEVSAPRTVATLDALTPQELQIAELAAAGYTNREIGARLYLSHRTVSSHLYKLFPKLGVTSRARLREALATQIRA